MAQSCLLRSKSVITVPQFTDALQRTWLESRRFRPRTVSALPRKLGLAVSGGADSMALAYLCRQWELQRQKQQQQEPEQEHHILSSNGNDSGYDEASVTAFVVDHKARPESTEEANTVAGWLRNLGITTQILPLDWTGVSLSAFETHARRLRFQALGKACRDACIDALLMGHHQDDNVETTIWRLSSGARGSGLAGIAPVARIPECHGLHGVAGSGNVATVHAEEYLASGQGQKKAEVQVSTGGILIHRPLLSFKKARLLATCHENNVPYVSDPTNFDPTLTPRNAIRSLLASKSLPRALQNESVLSLIGKCRGLIRDSHRLSDEILASQTRLLDTSLASGSITVQFRPSPASSPSSSPEEHEKENEHGEELSQQRLQELQSLTLRRITDLVSPYEDNHFPLSSFVNFTARVFHSNATSSASSDPEPELEEKTRTQPRKPFTLGGVLFHPLPSKSSNHDQHHNGDRWLLTRQPYMRRREPVLRFNVSRDIPTAPCQSIRPHAEVNSQCTVPWTLWDNRFWIRASMTTLRSMFTSNSDAVGQEPKEGEKGRVQLVIRPLRQSDLTPLKRLYNITKRKTMTITKHPLTQNRNESQSQNDEFYEDEEEIESQDTFDAGSFFAALDRDAPGQSLFTIPVLAVEEEEGFDVPLALPTMDLRFPALESMPWALTWEWKYKMIDLEALKLMGSV
ncbi:tRNA lysidine(34) synthetase [Aspergillus mulundensis]|uniref:tRNA(Ile)-lysidine synthetase n=1 Tax=Aspergillus mulundensis TaxID=1810919 RepID=A0A3D8QM91_9EURO|nr:hypothetical protein DSM5745_10067 [Aspergillus mulundensis]RDW62956.1 hypothetical protein DSM5745_10067 [Aspergillus mulundensis]